MKKTIALASLLALALGTSAAHAAKFYKWTDEKGVTHYTVDPPPAGAKSSQVRIKTSSVTDAEPPAPAAPGTAAKAAPAAGKEKGKDEKAAAGKAPEQYAERCKALRANLQSLEEHARVQERSASGESRILTEEEKNARLDTTRREIKAFCE